MTSGSGALLGNNLVIIIIEASDSFCKGKEKRYL